MKVLVSIFVSLIFYMSSCSTKKDLIEIDHTQYVSVLSYGVRANGKFDDRPGIQKAFENNTNIFFPTGRYNLKSKSNGEAFLVIDDVTKVRNLVFEKGAIIQIDDNPASDYFKPAVIGIMAWKNDISKIEINGLNIDGSKSKHTLSTTGIVTFEKNCNSVKELILNNIYIYNNNGGGIHTEANLNYFSNIKTENCGNHGIGINNTTCPNVLHEFYLDHYESINDNSYSIDFSGPEPINNPTTSLPEYYWMGRVTNVKSINSLYGIKTAGYWDLELDSILIDGSQNNGFYLSKDAPEKNISVKNLSIKNVLGNGLYLGGLSSFIGEKINIENCNVLLNIEKTNVKIDGLSMDGKGKNVATIRMGTSDVDINNFQILNNGPLDEYAIWVQGKNVSLTNGLFENIQGVAPIILHENSGQVFLNNLSFINWSKRNSNLVYSVMVIKKNGEVRIENCEFINKNNIGNRSKIDIKIDDK